MSEALILYRGRGGVDPELLKPTTITSNGNYVAPVTGNYMVYTVGGGGGGGGGCRNSWNSSQVFYGSGGSRGALNAKTVFLNAGDQVPITLGSGGSGGTNNTTVVSNNSRGTNGGSGGTTSFGSYASAAGGSYGSWSWSYHYWNNQVVGNWYRWNGSIINTYVYEALLNICRTGISDLNGMWSAHWANRTDGLYSIFWAYGLVLNTQIITNKTYVYVYARNAVNWGDIYNTKWAYGGLGYMNTNKWSDYIIPTICQVMNLNTIEKYYEAGDEHWRQKMGYPNPNSIGGRTPIHRIRFFNTSSDAYNFISKTIQTSGVIPSYTNMMADTFSAKYDWASITVPMVGWYTQQITESKIDNVSTRCYTSIQQGSWWYQNNNTVSTSGTRTYRGDGGTSGQAGNAGFILVIPPQS